MKKGILKYYFKEVLALEYFFSDSEKVEIKIVNVLIERSNNLHSATEIRGSSWLYFIIYSHINFDVVVVYYIHGGTM